MKAKGYDARFCGWTPEGKWSLEQPSVGLTFYETGTDAVSPIILFVIRT
jgi:hypothetical protein